MVEQRRDRARGSVNRCRSVALVIGDLLGWAIREAGERITATSLDDVGYASQRMGLSGPAGDRGAEEIGFRGEEIGFREPNAADSRLPRI